ncbi:TIR domain-containing protein [Lentzea sp. PSKA42]|uniref:TIR domain-containing protein n=1 Tax=Lentzea indica TaxID=2604800 RepID=A0ABX1FQE3_9PSEU|nr:FxSxx-COOH system tetratricopeptide repeat protein [Lentzea indica]NKE61024.1 TIR domain-containing protein [Lentzea indica]
MPEDPYRYDLTLSFAGEDRPYVEEVAQELRRSGLRIWYDGYETAELWGKNLTDHLDEIYGAGSRFVVMFVSAAYGRRLWTSQERRSVQARAFTAPGSQVLPVRFDDTEIPGMPPSVGYVDARAVTPGELADLLVRAVLRPDQAVVGTRPHPTGTTQLPRHPWRIFISHTSELRRWPQRKSFVDAAESAIKRAGHAPRDMAYFTASEQPPAQVCIDAVKDCDIYVLVAGFRYGSPVRNRPELSYTELEFETATSSRLPRLVFLLHEDTQGTFHTLADLDYGRRQATFREKLQESGLTTAAVENPDELETAILHSLTELMKQQSQTGPRLQAVSNVPVRSRTFVGRSPLLTKVRSSLLTGESVVVVLHGMGGVGKSSTAVEYAHRFSENYDVMWRVPAEDPAVVLDRLAELAHALQIAEPGDGSSAAVARLFGQLRQLDRWLIMFDNATDPDTLAEFLPQGPGHVVITSRNPSWRSVGTPIAVEELDRAEAVKLLRKLAPALGEQDAGLIADALNNLPLALEQAASLVHDYGVTAEAYLKMLGDPKRNVLAAELDGDRKSVAAAFKVTFEALSIQSPAAMQLATLLSWLAPEPVSLDLFTRHSAALPVPLASAAGDEILFPVLLAKLRSQSLVQIRQEAVQMHQVLATLLRANDFFPVGQEGTYRWQGVAAGFLRAALTANPDGEAGWPLWRQLLPHVLAVVEAAAGIPDLEDDTAWLRRGAGVYRRSTGDSFR